MNMGTHGSGSTISRHFSIDTINNSIQNIINMCCCMAIIQTMDTLNYFKFMSDKIENNPLLEEFMDTIE